MVIFNSYVKLPEGILPSGEKKTLAMDNGPFIEFLDCNRLYTFPPKPFSKNHSHCNVWFPKAEYLPLDESRQLKKASEILQSIYIVCFGICIVSVCIQNLAQLEESILTAPPFAADYSGSQKYGNGKLHESLLFNSLPQLIYLIYISYI